jgi:protease-4
MHSLSIAFKTQPLLIEPAKAKAYLDKVEAFDPTRIAGELDDVMEMLFGPQPQMIKSGTVAVIPVKGVIGNGLTELEKMMGSVDVEDVEEMLEEAERDPAIKVVIFDFDTPGGTVTGVPELAKRIRKCAKKTVGWTCKQSCSAGMWLMSQCDEVFVSPSSIVGSIGVYIPVLDISKAYEHEGVSVDVIASGWAKAAGYPGTKMTEAQRKLFLDDVVECHQWFIGDVSSVRTYAQTEDMQGQCWSGKKAAEKMLVDGLLDTFDDLLKYIGEEVYENYERAEKPVESVGPAGGYAQAKADVSPEQGDKDKDEGVEPVSKKKKKKKSDGEEEDDDLEEEIEPETPEIPDEGCPPIETDCKPKA